MISKETIKEIVDIIEPRIMEREPKGFEELFEFMLDELIDLNIEKVIKKK